MSESLNTELKQKVSDENWSKGKRIRTEISMTAKGLCQPSITIELLNQDRVITVKNPNDVADVDDQSIAEALFSQLDAIKVEANKREIKVTWE